MGKTFKAASDVFYDAGRYGQKNKQGFYNYANDKKGKLQKVITQESYELLAPHVAGSKEFSDEVIVARMMVPMATELARCLEEEIVSSASEADMALIYGLGFPPFRGGVFRWIDDIGIKAFAEMAAPLETLGQLYSLTDGMRTKLTKNNAYYTADKGE
jgi:3-hydroxyacyl-CoA dehydrogenase/enoyl-CoA hydratase/3-hydroxybutyryl-CoA epimerase/enoyl-CoA isomerase